MKFINILSSVIALYAVYYAVLIAWDTYMQKRNREDTSAPVDVFNPASEMASYETEQNNDGEAEAEPPIVVQETNSQDSKDDTSSIIDGLPASVILKRIRYEEARGPQALEEALDGLDIQWTKVSTEVA